MNRIKPYIKLMRIKHWVKNLLVLFPVIFSGMLFSRVDLLADSALGMAAFCLASSSVYIFNDLWDADRDKLHPVKKDRPIASGAASKPASVALLFILLAAAAALNFAATGLAEGVAAGPEEGPAVGPEVGQAVGPAVARVAGPALCLALYLGLNAIYSISWKNIPILDVTILASGFFLRVFYGSLVTGITMSAWLYLTIIALSFYLGLGKRRGEYKEGQNGETREVLSKYTLDFLSTNMTVFFALGLVFYSLWATDAETISRTSEYVIWTIPLVFVICLRYSFLISKGSLGDPVEVVWKDKPLIGLIVCFAFSIIAVVYMGL